jgi:hypothetical protein
MLTPETNYLVAVEQHNTRPRTYGTEPATADSQRRWQAVPPRLRLAYCWLGKRLQAWGARLEAIWGAPVTTGLWLKLKHLSHAPVSLRVT